MPVAAIAKQSQSLSLCVPVNNFLFRNSSANKAEETMMIVAQVAANAVRKQLRDLSHKIGPILQPVSAIFYS